MGKNLGTLAREATGIASDSRKVKNGYIFVAVKGLTSDGHNFIPEAIKNGAKFIIGQKEIKLGSQAQYIQVSDSREALGVLADEFYGQPSQKLKIIGVTGTKGKTTTCHLIYHILTDIGQKTGLISSIVAKIGMREMDTGFHVTSPDVVSLHKFLREMVDAGCKYAVIEVSSHGIDQQRIAGVQFEVGVLTNIAPEHLDYHKTFKEYKRIKMNFINLCKYRAFSPTETDLAILPGKFNNLNVEAALKAVSYLGVDRQKALKTLDSFDLPKGRLEEVINKSGFRIVIDFAHTPDSLEAALTYLRTTTKGRLISVFGCAGERDHKKRRRMGKISGQLADLSVFTAEDPRTENVSDIFRAMKKNAKNFVCIPERGEAIAYALSKARKGDTVGLFGKGHETSMAFKGFEHPWSDQQAVKDYLNVDQTVSSILLAAGKGSRMRSNIPKVAHSICGRPMIAYSLENLRRSGLNDLVIVVSFRKNLVEKIVNGSVKIAVQKTSKGGTADAAECGFNLVSKDSKTIMVINGDDSAFYTPLTIKHVLDAHNKTKSVITFVSLEKENPTGLGRVLRDKEGNVCGIVEEKNATQEERKIREINDGLYVFNRKWLGINLPKVGKNPISGERYLTDLIEVAILGKNKITAYKLPDPEEWQGINTPEELEKARAKMEAKLNGYKN